MDHSSPQASPTQHPTAVNTCRFTCSSLCISRVHKFNTSGHQQTTQAQARCVCPPRLPFPSHSNFDSASTVIYIVVLDVAYQNMWMGVPNVLVIRTKHISSAKIHPSLSENPDVGIPLAIRSRFLASFLTSPRR